MGNKILFHALLAFVLLFSACKSNKIVVEKQAELPILKQPNFMEIMDKADANEDLVFVKIYTDWCLPCMVMDEEVFTDKSFVQYMDERFVQINIDAEKGQGPDVSVIYEIKEFPTLLFLNGKGHVLARKNGLAFQDEIKALAQQAIDSQQL